jgi:hypothetical protein
LIEALAGGKGRGVAFAAMLPVPAILIDRAAS